MTTASKSGGWRSWLVSLLIRLQLRLKELMLLPRPFKYVGDHSINMFFSEGDYIMLQSIRDDTLCHIKPSGINVDLDKTKYLRRHDLKLKLVGQGIRTKLALLPSMSK